MTDFTTIITVVSIFLSLIAQVILIKAALKFSGGAISKMLNYIILGIFLSYFLHSVVEFLLSFHILEEDMAIVVMSSFLLLGSIFFVIAGLVFLRSTKK